MFIIGIISLLALIEISRTENEPKHFYQEESFDKKVNDNKIETTSICEEYAKQDVTLSRVNTNSSQKDYKINGVWNATA